MHLCAQDESAADAAGPSKEARLEAAAAEAEVAVARVFQEELGVTVPLEVDALQPAGPMGAARDSTRVLLSSQEAQNLPLNMWVQRPTVCFRADTSRRRPCFRRCACGGKYGLQGYLRLTQPPNITCVHI